MIIVGCKHAVYFSHLYPRYICYKSGDRLSDRKARSISSSTRNIHSSSSLSPDIENRASFFRYRPRVRIENKIQLELDGRFNGSVLAFPQARD